MIEKGDLLSSFEDLIPNDRTHSLDLSWVSKIRNHERDDYLRQLGVRWVNERYHDWLSESGVKAKDKTIKRFHLEGKPFEYYMAEYSALSPLLDMPPEKTDVAIIGVGPSLVIRSGFRLDVKSTSYSYSMSFRVIVHVEQLVTENEFNYPDIIDVTYEREYYKGYGPRPLSDGTLILRLTDGTSCEFRFDEPGIKTVIDAIRGKIHSLEREGAAKKPVLDSPIRST
ncbi:MAG: hypothetical protein ACHQQQ_02715 [Bacteroidota bacterium]